jgi:hypothetical protein
VRLAAFVLLLCVIALPAQAQRRRAVPTPPPIAASLSHGAAAYEYVLSITASADVHVATDLRLLRLEVAAAGSRRATRCDARPGPRRFEDAGDHVLTSGGEWHASFDVRTICWGRALTALDAGGELRGSFGVARGRGVPIARASGVETRSVTIAPIVVDPRPAAAAPEGDVRISLARSDAVNGERVSLRVSVRAVRAVRAWVRPDRVAFRVASPDGTTRTCAVSHFAAAPIPDLFARLTTRSGPTLSLEARRYCTPSVFAHAGIYEVTPILTLDADGRPWHLDTPLGTFEGAPSFVRVRADAPERP